MLKNLMTVLVAVAAVLAALHVASALVAVPASPHHPAPGVSHQQRMIHPALAPASASKRRVSYWMAASNTTATAAILQLLAAEGATQVATSVFLYCGSSISDTGAFLSQTNSPGCMQAIKGLHAMGISVETEIGISLVGLRLMVSNQTVRNATIAALKQNALKYNLQGISWDLEPKGSTHTDCVDFSAYLGDLAAAVNPSGIRVSTYSNSFDPVISDVGVLAQGANLVTGGQTYNGDSFAAWLVNYHVLINNNIPHDKVTCGMLASTERGTWNCEPASMQQRMDKMYNDTLIEFSIFVLVDPSNPDGHCTFQWLPYAREWIKTPVIAQNP